MKRVVLSLVLLLHAARARADEAPETRRWYGWQILLADAAVIGAAIGSRNAGVLYGVFATGPILHVANGRLAAGTASLGLRVGLPFLGAALGNALCEPEPGEWFPCMDEVGMGLVFGYVAALAIDLGMAQRKVKVERPPPYVPLVRIGSDGALGGVAFTF
jgi:hypothetical protein